MTWLLFLSLAVAQSPLGPRTPVQNPSALAEDAKLPMGELVLDARQPAEVLVNGQKLVEILVPGRVEVPFPAGKYDLRVWTAGTATEIEIKIPVGGVSTVLVGRTGISAKSSGGDLLAVPVSEVPVGPSPTEFRAVGIDAVMIHLDGKRHRIQAADPLRLDLTPGRHPMSVRNSNGTVIWATGTLLVKGNDPIIVQITEGRVPEVTGGATFSMGG